MAWQDSWKLKEKRKEYGQPNPGWHYNCKPNSIGRYIVFIIDNGGEIDYMVSFFDGKNWLDAQGHNQLDLSDDSLYAWSAIPLPGDE